jgi:hypothetical protein
MGQLRLKGIAQYAPGPWGAAIPASGVAVEIIDIDANPRSNDLIWTGITGSDGTFAGISSEWQDTVTVGFGAAQRQVADVTDVLALSARLVEMRAGQRKEVTLPFQFIRNDFLSPPLVLPWEPPNPIKGKVNGLPCWTLNEFVEKVKSSVLSRTLADVEVTTNQGKELGSVIRQAFNKIGQHRQQKAEGEKPGDKYTQLEKDLVTKSQAIISSGLNLTKTVWGKTEKVMGNALNPIHKNLSNRSIQKDLELLGQAGLTAALRILAEAICNLNIEAPVREAALLIINSVIATVSVAGSIPDIIIHAMSSVVTVVGSLGGYLVNNGSVVVVAMVCVIILIAAYLAANGFNIALAGMRITNESMMVSVRNMR